MTKEEMLIILAWLLFALLLCVYIPVRLFLLFFEWVIEWTDAKLDTVLG